MATDAPARYNPKNVMLQPHELGHLLTRFGVDAPYTDINIYRRAFVNRSYCTKKNENYVNGNVGCPPGCMPLQEESNERLEYLGDAILNKTIAMYTFQRFPKDNEGFLTIMRTKLVNGVQLAKFAKELGMDRFVIISAQLEESGGRSHKSTLEDAFEAFVAAIYLDFEEAHGTGSAVSTQWITTMVENLVDVVSMIKSNVNYKDKLVKLCQHNFNFVPTFEEHSNKNRQGEVHHKVIVKDNMGVTIAVSKDRRKKEAEVDAARKALEYYGDK